MLTNRLMASFIAETWKQSGPGSNREASRVHWLCLGLCWTSFAKDGPGQRCPFSGRVRCTRRTARRVTGSLRSRARDGIRPYWPSCERTITVNILVRLVPDEAPRRNGLFFSPTEVTDHLPRKSPPSRFWSSRSNRLGQEIERRIKSAR